MDDPTPRPKPSTPGNFRATPRAHIPEPPPGAPARDVLRWQVQDFPPEVQALALALGDQLAPAQVDLLARLLSRLDDAVSTRMMDEMDAFGRLILAHLGVPAATFDVLDEHCRNQELDTTCSVCQTVGLPPVPAA